LFNENYVTELKENREVLHVYESEEGVDLEDDDELCSASPASRVTSVNSNVQAFSTEKNL